MQDSTFIGLVVAAKQYMVTTPELYWSAGFLEGEGYFQASPKHRGNIYVGASQVEREPLDRLQKAFGGSFHRKHYGGNTHDQWVWTVRGAQAVAVMLTLYSLLSLKRRKQVEAALNLWKQWGIANKYKHYCVHGHPLSGDNLYLAPNGKRECRICRERRWRAFYEKMKGKRN